MRKCHSFLVLWSIKRYLNERNLLVYKTTSLKNLLIVITFFSTSLLGIDNTVNLVPVRRTVYQIYITSAYRLPTSSN